jgi:DNA-binding MarR family transcriptional regulator
LLEQEPLARLIAGARRRINQAVGRCLHSHRLNPQRFWVLVNLSEAPGSSLRELAGRMRADEPTASRIIASLGRRRLVRARADPADRRRRILELTAAGESLARSLAPVAKEVRRAVEAGFTPEEKETLRLLLGRVIDNMDALERQHAADRGDSGMHPKIEPLAVGRASDDSH